MPLKFVYLRLIGLATDERNRSERTAALRRRQCCARKQEVVRGWDREKVFALPVRRANGSRGTGSSSVPYTAAVASRLTLVSEISLLCTSSQSSELSFFRFLERG